MIDTLKLSKRLTAAHMPTEQAEALSEGLGESLREEYVSRDYLDARRAEDRAWSDGRFAALEGRLNLVQWMIGFNLVLTIAVVGRLFLK